MERFRGTCMGGLVYKYVRVANIFNWYLAIIVLKLFMYSSRGIMASSSEIVNAATTNGLDLHTAKPPYIQFVSWSCNWAFLYPESALRILRGDARFKLHRDHRVSNWSPTSQNSGQTL